MPTYYVGPGGNDGNTGLSWAQRKLTLNGAEDIPVQPGDVCYVGPGVYREQLTVDVSGAAGSPITYIGDYTGANTDGVGGVVRITGSDDDQTITRRYCIVNNSRNYRTFTGFHLDLASITCIFLGGCTNIIIDGCFLQVYSTASAIATTLAGQGDITVKNSYIRSSPGGVSAGVLFSEVATKDDAGHIVENCIFTGPNGVYISKVGGITIKNSVFIDCHTGVIIVQSPSAGQFVTVNNSLVVNCVSAGLRCAPADGSLVSNYNNVYGNNPNYTNVAVGANDLSYPPLLDTRWFFELVNGGRLVSPYDLSQWSQLINVAGTNPTATDMRRTGAIGGVREWGPLEYDTTLEVEGGGGAVSISPYRGNL